MKKTQSHEHADLVRRLEESHFIFAQAPKLITEVVKAENLSPVDKILLRAHKIDSDGKISTALNQAKSYTQGSTRLVYLGYFLLGLTGVLGLMVAQVVNFFYVVAALLGWHSLSLLWWLVGLFGRRMSFLGNIFDNWTLKNPLINKIIGIDDNPAVQHALKLQLDLHRSHLRWYLGKILHGAWLSSLIGAVLALLCLFLFRRYDFIWESTLLTDAHFERMMQLFGALPQMLGFELPNRQMPPAQQNAHFAWLIMLAIILYGFLPRLLCFVICALKSRIHFQIDEKLPYYANLIRIFTQKIIDQDDYKASTPAPAKAIDLHGKTFISAILERPTAVNFDKSINIAHEFGVIDDRTSIDALIQTAKTANALIFLIIDAHILPDRGVWRKVSSLIQTGLVVKIANQDHAANDHSQAWQDKLQEHGIALIE